MGDQARPIRRKGRNSVFEKSESIHARPVSTFLRSEDGTLNLSAHRCAEREQVAAGGCPERRRDCGGERGVGQVTQAWRGEAQSAALGMGPVNANATVRSRDALKPAAAEH